MAKTTRRMERVGSLIRDCLADAIRTRLNDPRIPSITSITRVEVTPDFGLARVHISVLAPERRRKLCVAALQRSAGHLRRLIGQEVTLWKLPELRFELDESLQRGHETVELIDRVMQEYQGDEDADDELDDLGMSVEWDDEDDPSAGDDEEDARA